MKRTQMIVLMVGIAVIAGFTGAGAVLWFKRPVVAATAPSGPMGDLPAAPVGSAVHVDSLVVKIDYVRCSDSYPDDTGLPEPSGVWCAVQLNASNVGNAPDDLDASGVVVFSVQGQRFEQDADATTFADSASAGRGSAGQLDKKINPGITAYGLIMYDIPKYERIVRVGIRDHAGQMTLVAVTAE